MRDVIETQCNSQSTWSVPGGLEASRQKFNREPFKVTHGLHKLEIFEVQQLAAVSGKAKNIHFDTGSVKIDDRWGDIPTPEMPVERVIELIRENRAWVILKEMEAVAPGYKQVLDEFTNYVRSIAGPEMAKILKKPEMLAIVSSPGRITPFHFDAEVNFLVQIHGEKRVWVCDPTDRKVVTDKDIEEYYYCYNPGTYRPGVEQRAQSFVLKPGEGIHIPTHAAHWVENGDDISVSLSLNFEQETGSFNDVLFANRWLRKVGTRPMPPGQSRWRDEAKGVAGRGIRRLRDSLAAVSGKYPAR
jgi:hypothetical protein